MKEAQNNFAFCLLQESFALLIPRRQKTSEAVLVQGRTYALNWVECRAVWYLPDRSLTEEEVRLVAIFHLALKMIKRALGQSAVAASAYRTAKKLIDERTGEVANYTRKKGVAGSAILSARGSPEWIQDSAALWNAVEKAGRQYNNQPAREMNVALPVEIPDQEKAILARDYVLKEIVDKHGMIAELALHFDDPKNPHFHVMMPTRRLSADGQTFGKVERNWQDKKVLLGWREEWAKHCNAMLEKHGHTAKIDHRSLKDMGITDRNPTAHRGAIGQKMLEERDQLTQQIQSEVKKIDQQSQPTKGKTKGLTL